VDPYQRKALAEADIQATAAARVEREAQATLQAAREAGQTEQEIARVMAPVHAKETEIALESTAVANRAAAATLGAAQTAQAFRDSAAAFEAEKLRAEQMLELESRRRKEANDAAWASVWRWALPILELFLAIAIGGAFAAGLYFYRGAGWSTVSGSSDKKSMALLSDGSKWFRSGSTSKAGRKSLARPCRWVAPTETEATISRWSYPAPGATARRCAPWDRLAM
jgi:hypothetical protein